MTMTHFAEEINGIMNELSKAENRDLLFAVVALGDSTADQSFMFGFTQRKTLSFDDFCAFEHQIDLVLRPALNIDEDLRSMSDRYDEYLVLVDDHNARVSCDNDQTARFNAIVDPYADAGGWSGAVYGLVLRQVQANLRAMLNG